MKRAAFSVAQPRSTALRPLNYSPEVERLRTSRNASVALGSLLRELGPAYGMVFTRLDCAPEFGVELLSQSDMFAAEPSGRMIRRDSMARPDRHVVRKWQVLIAGAGTLGDTELYGRCVIADGRLAGKCVGPDALALTFEDEGSDLNLYCHAFLSSSLGIKALRSASYGTKILRTRNDIVSELPIPLADDKTIRRVATLIRETVEQRGRYAQTIAAARRVMEQIPVMQEAHAMCAERRARCIAWPDELPTMAAWNYASTGGAFSFLSSKCTGRLADLVVENGVFNGPRFARVECETPHGIAFYSQRDLFMMRPVPQRIVRPPIPDRQLFVDAETVLAGSHGQMSEGSLFGRVELAAFGARSAGLTQDILRLQPRPGCGQLLYGFLSTGIGQRLFKSTAVGTSIPSVRIDLALRLPVPDLGTNRTQELSRFIHDATVARIAASAAESEAIRLIEVEVLPQWLG